MAFTNAILQYKIQNLYQATNGVSRSGGRLRACLPNRLASNQAALNTFHTTSRSQGYGSSQIRPPGFPKDTSLKRSSVAGSLFKGSVAQSNLLTGTTAITLR